MSLFSGIAYAQARIQSRYGERADSGVWMRLNNVQDLGSYLQTAQQTPLRPWVLGMSASQSSDDIELTLRQKFRGHIDEVAGWMPLQWQKPLRLSGLLIDLPVFQHLAAGGEVMDWMEADPDVSAFTADDTAVRIQALRAAGLGDLVDSWQQGATMLPGWVTLWNRSRPRAYSANHGLRALEKLLYQQMQAQAKQQKVALNTDYEVLLDRLRALFRRYAFEPAGICAYVAIVAIDVHRLRSDLVQRLFFLLSEKYDEELTA